MEEDKDFIDFEFNGHWASEFKLLAVSDGDRYTSPFYGSVSPNTSTLVGKVGVHKWKTQVGEKEFNIQIAYDDVDLGTLRKIKEWLNPFVIGKLVFKEEPYKYYWVSLSEDPQISFLPFRTEDLIVDGKSYKKGVYKGDFTLNFICVDNYGYSDWSSFDENFDYLVNEIKGENFITFDDGSDNNLILTKIEGGFAQETKSAIPYTNVEGNDLQLTDVENVDTQNWIIKGGHHQVQTDEEKTTVNGESISISDVDDSKPADIVIKGNHYQATREGYNLANINISSQTKGGVNITVNNNKSITFNGTTTVAFNFLLTDAFILKAGTYKLYANKEAGTNLFGNFSVIKSEDNSIIKTMNFNYSNVNFTLEEETAVKIQAYLPRGAVLNNFTIFPMIYSGTDIKAYEQYGASPSPDYPSEIETVGSNINEFDINNLTTVYGGEKNINEIISNKMSGNYKFVKTSITNTKLVANNTYTVSFKAKKNEGTYSNNLGFQIFDADGKVTLQMVENSPALSEKYQVYSFTFTITANINVTALLFQLQQNASEVIMSIKDIKLEKGTVATPYSPFGMGSVETDVVNKNLLDMSKYVVDSWEQQLNGFILNLRAGTYTLSSNINFSTIKGSEHNSSAWSNVRFGAADINKKYFTFTIGEEFKETNNEFLWMMCINNSGKTIAITKDNIDEFDIQLQVGNKADSFEEHQSQTAIMPIQQEMLEGDYIADVEHHEWEKVVFDGSENWVASTETEQYIQFMVRTESYVFDKIICNIFSAISTNERTKKSGCVLFNDEHFRISLLKNDYSVRTLEEFKQWLSENNLLVYCRLATPLNLELTEEQKAVREQIFNTKLYSGVTNIINRSSYPALLNLDYNIIRQRPTFDWPSEVETVKDNVEINVVNKNYLTKVHQQTKTFNNVNFEINENGEINIQGLANASGEITFELERPCKMSNLINKIVELIVEGTPTATIGMRFLDGNTRLFELIPKSKTVTLNLDDNYTNKNITAIQFYVNNTADYNLIIKPGIYAEFQTKFTPHQSKTTIIPTQQELLEGDYIDKSKEYHKWEKIIIDTSKLIEDVTNEEGKKRYRYKYNKNIKKSDVTNNVAYSNMFELLGDGQTFFNVKGFTIVNNNIYIYNEGESLTEFKSKLTDKQLVFYAQLETSTKLELTTEQKIAMNELNASQFYLNITNLSLSNSVAKVNFDYNGYDGMPSPRYPSELQVVKDSVDITISNKNLFNFNKLNTQNTNLIIQGNKLIGNNVPNIVIGTAPNSNALIEKTLLSGTYTVSFDIISESSSELINCYFCCQQVDGTYNNYYNGKAIILLPNEKNRVSYEYKITKAVQKIGIVGYLQGNTNLEISDIAIIEGTDDKYTEYKEQVISMPVQQELFKDDYIEDVEHHEWKKIIVDGVNYGAFYVFPNGRFVVANPSTGEIAGRDVIAIRDWAVSEPEHIFCNYLPTVSIADQTQKNMLGITNGATGEIVMKLDRSTEDNNTWTKETVNEYLQQQNEKGQPLTVWYKTTEPYDLELTEDQADIKENCKDFVYSYPGANYISANTTLPKLSISYMPEQDLTIDFVADGSNLLNSSSFYYTNEIYLKSFKDKETGNPDTSGITSSRVEYLFNAGNQPANLNLTFDYIPPQQGAPLEINIDKVQLTNNGWKTLEKKYTSISLEYFEAFKPFTDLLKKAYSIDDLSNLPSNWQNDWQLEINSEIKEIYFKNKHNKDLVISLNKFNKKQEFLQLCGSNFVDYSKPFPTLITEVEESAIADTYFNKVYLTATAQDYRLKNINLEWKHTYL